MLTEWPISSIHLTMSLLPRMSDKLFAGLALRVLSSRTASCASQQRRSVFVGFSDLVRHSIVFLLCVQIAQQMKTEGRRQQLSLLYLGGNPICLAGAEVLNGRHKVEQPIMHDALEMFPRHSTNMYVVVRIRLHHQQHFRPCAQR